MFNNILLEERHTVLIKLLKRNNPDIICLQEVLAPLTDWFIAELDGYLPMSKVLLPQGRPYGEMIFVRKDITALSTDWIPLPSKMGRALLHVKVKKAGKVWNIITFHLESLNCRKVRREQLAILWSTVANLQNVICCGDTNQTAKEVCVLPDNILDAWENTDHEIGEYTYFGHRYWGSSAKQRYDKVWYTNDLELVGFGIIGNNKIGKVWVSDHDGILTIFE